MINIELNCASYEEAKKLKGKIISKVRKGDFDTWSYTSLQKKDLPLLEDFIFHNPEQFVNDKEKNVVFKVEIRGDKVVFIGGYWTGNPVPTYEMYALHTGRLTEMLLKIETIPPLKVLP